MEHFLETLLFAVVVSLFLIPVIFALVIATFAANLFSVLFKPISRPLHKLSAKVYDRIPNPLEQIPMFPKIKRYFGSTKNILFICFVIVFLVIHYLSMEAVENLFDHIALLFPGSALEQVTSYGTYNGKLDLSSFFVHPGSYLQTIVFAFISGLFMHFGCTTKDPDAHVHLLVQVFYTVLITLFSSIVLGMIPADLFQISIPEISWDFTSTGTVTGGSDIWLLWEELRNLVGTLLEKLLGIIPTIVALYFLAHSVSGFGAAFLGGFVAICAVAIGWPNGLADPHSLQAKFLLILILAIGEVLALFFSEFLNKGVEAWVSKNSAFLTYYNVVSLLISYFFYPALGLSVLCFISILVNGFQFALLALTLGGLLVFCLATFAGYQITLWTSEEGAGLNGTAYATAMVVNVPIWIIYLVLFVL